MHKKIGSPQGADVQISCGRSLAHLNRQVDQADFLVTAALRAAGLAAGLATGFLTAGFLATFFAAGLVAVFFAAGFSVFFVMTFFR